MLVFYLSQKQVFLVHIPSQPCVPSTGEFSGTAELWPMSDAKEESCFGIALYFCGGPDLTTERKAVTFSSTCALW